MDEDSPELSQSIDDLIEVQRTSQKWRDEDKATDERIAALEERSLIINSLDWINKLYYVQLIAKKIELLRRK